MDYIVLNNVTYTYPLAKNPTIKNINISLEKGKIYALIGANSSGKTTLCNLIRGFAPKFYNGELSGSIIIEGRDISELSLGEIAPKMGYVFQNPFNQITGARDNVFEEVAYGLEKFGVEPSIIKTRVEEVLKITNTEYLKDKNPFELSGGQQQRVALASIIVLEPDILVIDEPTSQLDPRETERVFDIIIKMKELGKTIILVEHKMELIAEYADDVIVLHEGEIVKYGDKHEVLTDMSLVDYGIQLPNAVLIAKGLKDKGINIKGKPITSDEIISQLKEILSLKDGDTND